MEVLKKDDWYTFEDTVYSVIENRFGVKKKVKQKCEEFLLGLRELSRTDEWADDFKKFMGFDDPKKYVKEVLNLYLFHLHSTDHSFAELLSPTASELYIEIIDGIKKCNSVFFNAPSSIRQ